ncbi:YihA family ribosome biogenesis GTP-binding protein [Candidatus Poribacteria bacterium]|nr:YihA family ribosome biogenesis GTP-binding protein [Candidatus Poribacteria bacterium]
MKITSAEYIISAFDKTQFPQNRLPEVAFAGRSNVGKSSLLNRLAGKDIARISRTPGKTRAVNFFLMNNKFYFVDLPGYGFARVSKSMRRGWHELIEGYISGRPNLAAVIVLIDSRREEIPDADLQMIDYLCHIRISSIPVFTKIDKLNRSELARLKQAAIRKLPESSESIFFSAVTCEGVADLLNRIDGCLH